MNNQNPHNTTINNTNSLLELQNCKRRLELYDFLHSRGFLFIPYYGDFAWCKHSETNIISAKDNTLILKIKDSFRFLIRTESYVFSKEEAEFALCFLEEMSEKNLISLDQNPTRHDIHILIRGNNFYTDIFSSHPSLVMKDGTLDKDLWKGICFIGNLMFNDNLSDNTYIKEIIIELINPEERKARLITKSSTLPAEYKHDSNILFMPHDLFDKLEGIR